MSAEITRVDLSGTDPDEAVTHLCRLLPFRTVSLPDAVDTVPFRYRFVGDDRVRAGTVRLEVPWHAAARDDSGYVLVWAAGTSVTVELGSQTRRSEPGVPAMLPTGRPFTLTNVRSTLNVVRFDNRFLESVAGNHLKIPIGPLAFTPDPEAPSLARLLRVLSSAAPALLDPATAAEARRAVDDDVAVAVVTALRAHPHRSLMLDENAGVFARGQAYIADHLHEPLTLERIASGLDTTVDDVRLSFHRHGDTTPADYLRQARLYRVRSDLRGGGATAPVAEIASRWGFTDLSRFAEAYQTEFGEPPGVRVDRDAAEGSTPLV